MVAAVRALPVDRVVLDGESIGLDERGRPHRFQDTMSTFSREGPAATAVALQAFFFDVLHLDGEDLVDRPLRERLILLDSIAQPLRLPALTTADPVEAASFAAEALAAGHEGVMVKALDAPYQAGRRGGSWRKVKPVRTLDLVVLAAEWGHGRRTGWLSNLHLGARGPDGGVRHGRQDLQGPHRRRCCAGRPSASRLWPSAPMAMWSMCRPEQVVEVALDGVQVLVAVPGRSGPALRPCPSLPRRQAGRRGRHRRSGPSAPGLTHAARTMRPTEAKWHRPASTVQLCQTSWYPKTAGAGLGRPVASTMLPAV